MAAPADLSPLPGLLPGGGVVQVAYHVDDVREAARRWHELTGVGPFFVQEHVPLVSARSGGQDVVFDQTCAVTQWGEVMLELVQLHTIEPPELEATVVPGGHGLHHVAVMVEDLDAALEAFERRGHRVVLDAATEQVRFVFVDPGPELGHLVECYEAVPYLQKLYAAVRRAAERWDGAELFR
jgi:hypothetical protein